MKKTSQNSLVQLTQLELKNLTNQVEETVPGEFYQPTLAKTFTGADLWNIQRQGRPRMQRRLI